MPSDRCLLYVRREIRQLKNRIILKRQYMKKYILLFLLFVGIRTAKYRICKDGLYVKNNGDYALWLIKIKETANHSDP